MQRGGTKYKPFFTEQRNKGAFDTPKNAPSESCQKFLSVTLRQRKPRITPYQY